MTSRLVCLSRMPEICELPDRKLVAGAAALVRRLVVEHTHRYPVTVCLFPEQNIQPLHHSNGHPLKKEQPEQSHPRSVLRIRIRTVFLGLTDPLVRCADSRIRIRTTAERHYCDEGNN